LLSQTEQCDSNLTCDAERCVTDETDEPKPPRDISVDDIDSNSCTVTYPPPLFEGLSPVIGYILQFKTPDTQSWLSLNKRPITGTSVRVGQLHPGITYQFRVAAVNAHGVGKYSRSSTPVTTDDNKPIQPHCPVVRTDGTPVDLEWTMPCDDSESANFRYIIQIHYHSADTDGRMFVVTERKAGPVVRHSLSIEMKPEISYDFAVAAVNEAGVGPYSVTSQPTTVLSGKSWLCFRQSAVAHLPLRQQGFLVTKTNLMVLFCANKHLTSITALYSIFDSLLVILLNENVRTRGDNQDALILHG